MTNPYQPPEIATEPLQGIAGKEAPLIWFAAPVVILLFGQHFGWFLYHNADLFEQLGAFETVMEAVFRSLRRAGPIVISAVVMYAAMRQVFRQRFEYPSTRVSLFFAGVVVFGYLAAFQHWDWQRAWNDNWAWLVGTLVGIPFGYSVAALERLVTRLVLSRGDQSNCANAGSVPTQASHASIFWFSAAVFVSIFTILTFTRPRSLTISVVFEMVELSAAACLMFTAFYGLLSACFVRAYPATSLSRVTAAAVYIGAFFAAAYLQSILLVMTLGLVGSAFLAVHADRLVARYAAA